MCTWRTDDGSSPVFVNDAPDDAEELVETTEDVTPPTTT
jgi:hypothetical protein